MMAEKLQAFKYEEQSVRVLARDGLIWFVAEDICKILGYHDTRAALEAYLSEDEKGVTINYRPSYNQRINIITLSGVYWLIVNSYMEKQKEFRQWITCEVMPQVMRRACFSKSKNKLMLNEMYAAQMIYKAAGLQGIELAEALDKVAEYYTGNSLLRIGGV